MNIKEKIINIITSVCEKESVREYLEKNDDLTQLYINSIVFIKIVVELENAFEIEFEDAELDFKRFKSLTTLSDYVEKLVQEYAN